MELQLICLRCGNTNRDTSLTCLLLLDIMSTQTALYIARLGMQSRLMSMRYTEELERRTGL
ncbi:hypothetical protein D1872_49540 [compost metagenome]